MTETTSILDSMTQKEDKPFQEYEEQAIIALIVDHPEFFVSFNRHLKPDLFKSPEVMLVMGVLLNYHEKYDTYPSRDMLITQLKKQLTVDTIGYEDILKIASQPSNPRDVPALKDSIMSWVKRQAYGLIYDPETIQKYNSGDYDAIEKIIEEARNIQDIGLESFWVFDQLEKLFIEENVENFSTGFPKLDAFLNAGGPSRKEMLVWMAPTGVGKSLVMINNAIAGVLKNHNVLLVTLELSDVKSAIRAMGAMTGTEIANNKHMDNKQSIMDIVKRIRSKKEIGDLVIHEFPPDEISVDVISALVDQLKKRHGWAPDIIIVDYLELMVSRRESDNKDSYMRQKATATQLRGLAKKENVVVITATQTNRSGNTDEVIDVTKMAESYGKAMPMDYLVSISQSDDEYNEVPARARMYIAKNRNGRKFETIPIKIDYRTMKSTELEL